MSRIQPQGFRASTFTFQSGSIQMSISKVSRRLGRTLHSNLVLFKFLQWPLYTLLENLYIPIWFYSNKYAGYMPVTSELSLHSNLVLFKLYPLRVIYYHILLYIPIWFYSNTDATNIVIERYAFTFQSGSIQIVGNTTSQYYQDHFTFQSGSIQIS